MNGCGSIRREPPVCPSASPERVRAALPRMSEQMAESEARWAERQKQPEAEWSVLGASMQETDRRLEQDGEPLRRPMGEADGESGRGRPGAAARPKGSPQLAPAPAGGSAPLFSPFASPGIGDRFTAQRVLTIAGMRPGRWSLAIPCGHRVEIERMRAMLLRMRNTIRFQADQRRRRHDWTAPRRDASAGSVPRTTRRDVLGTVRKAVAPVAGIVPRGRWARGEPWVCTPHILIEFQRDIRIYSIAIFTLALTGNLCLSMRACYCRAQDGKRTGLRSPESGAWYST